jgi:hypothetical protein
MSEKVKSRTTAGYSDCLITELARRIEFRRGTSYGQMSRDAKQKAERYTTELKKKLLEALKEEALE